ncbi:MAG: EamA family transporter [Acidimicrobiia bacterium]
MSGPPTTNTPGARVWLALGTIYVVWGSTYLAIAVTVETIPPLLSSGARFVLAGALLYLLVRWRADEAPKAIHWRSALVVGGLLVGANGVLSVAEQTVPSGLASLLIATVPFWMVLGASVFFSTRTSRAEWIGIGVGFVGVVVLVGRPAEGASLLAVSVVLIASIAWAAGSILSPRLEAPSSTLLAVSMQMLAGGALMLLLGVMVGEVEDVQLGEFSTSSVVAFFYLVVVSSMIAFPAYIWVLGAAPTSLVSTYAYVNPVIAVMLGTALRNEPLDARLVLGGALIVTAVFVIVTAAARSPKPAPPPLREAPP